MKYVGLVAVFLAGGLFGSAMESHFVTKPWVEVAERAVVLAEDYALALSICQGMLPSTPNNTPSSTALEL